MDKEKDELLKMVASYGGKDTKWEKVGKGEWGGKILNGGKDYYILACSSGGFMICQTDFEVTEHGKFIKIHDWFHYPFKTSFGEPLTLHSLYIGLKAKAVMHDNEVREYTRCSHYEAFEVAWKGGSNWGADYYTPDSRNYETCHWGRVPNDKKTAVLGVYEANAPTCICLDGITSYIRIDFDILGEY